MCMGSLNYLGVQLHIAIFSKCLENSSFPKERGGELGGRYISILTTRNVRVTFRVGVGGGGWSHDDSKRKHR